MQTITIAYLTLFILDCIIALCVAYKYKRFKGKQMTNDGFQNIYKSLGGEKDITTNTCKGNKWQK